MLSWNIAKADTFLFWYPGGAGSTEDAKSVLEIFCEGINESVKGLKLEGMYINTESEGIAFIKKKRPPVAIISYPTWEKFKSQLPQAKPLLSTNPLPHGKAIENYALYGSQKLDLNTIYTSEPLERKFINATLFPEIKIPATAKVITTDKMLSILRQIASGETKGAAILTPFEVHSIEMLKPKWSENIKRITLSKPIPTAQLFLLNQNWKYADKLKDALLGLTKDSNEILAELRLKGFSEVK